MSEEKEIPMVDLSAPVLAADGSEERHGEDPVTIGKLVETALLASEQGQDQAAKVAAFRLWRACAGKAGHAFTAKEVEQVLSQAAKVLTTLAYGQLVEALDPAQLSD